MPPIQRNNIVREIILLCKKILNSLGAEAGATICTLWEEMNVQGGHGRYVTPILLDLLSRAYISIQNNLLLSAIERSTNLHRCDELRNLIEHLN
jgi:hypothetical protein